MSAKSVIMQSASRQSNTGAMITTPLSPAYDTSADHIEYDSSNGRTPTSESISYTNHPFAPVTPISPNNIPNDEEETYIWGNRSLSEELMEESDQDMSDGGAPLTIQPQELDTEEPTAEMDTVDIETMDQLLDQGNYDSHYQSSTDHPSTMEVFGDVNSLSVPEDNLHMYDILEFTNNTDLPAHMMSEVSQQLQHIQDGQEHEEFGSTPDHHDLFVNHNQSTLPHVLSNLTLLYPNSPYNLSDLIHGHEDSSSVSYLEDPMTYAIPHTDQVEVDPQMDFSSFLEDWARSRDRRDPNQPRTNTPSYPAVTNILLKKDLESVRRCDLQGEKCDIQGINWKELRVTRLEARQRRQATYQNYTNLIYPNRSQLHPRRIYGTTLEDVDNYFGFRQLDFRHKVVISHFQLRNLITCPSQGSVVYAATTKALHYNPIIDSAPSELMDLKMSRALSLHAVSHGYQISTLTSGHDIVVAGGYEGQYALTSTRAPRDSKHIEGVITEQPNDITNHAQVHLSRSSSPLVTFASNDSGIRTLDVTTNKFISEHMYDYAINCTAISPDRRLRVMVGDNRKVMICNSDTGGVLQELDGHLDYGFACDWSENGWTVATGNQDMQVNIWDARYWSRPVISIAAAMAGVRKLKFSPLGSGRPILVAAEPADYVNIINAETFDSKQTLSFFGEIGGFDFTNMGQELIVANCDKARGGIFAFERCDFATEGLCGKDRQVRSFMAGIERDYKGSTDDDPMEESPELRGTTKRREKRNALLTKLGSF